MTLVLTKSISEAAADISTNTAEIYSTYNSLGLADTDSTEGNNTQNEDDMSTASLIVTIKTGALTYTLIILGSIALLALLAGGIYLIEKKVMSRKF